MPSGKCGESLPSLASGGSVAGSFDAVDALVGHDRPRPALVVVRVVLDQPHLGRLVDDLAVLDQVDAAVELRQVRVLMIDRAGRIDGQQVIVGRAAGMRELADGGRVLVAEDRTDRPGLRCSGERRERDAARRHERHAIVLAAVPLSSRPNRQGGFRGSFMYAGPNAA